MSAAMVGFLGLCLVMTLTPGLDTAMVMRNALRRGPAAGVRTAIGCALGLFVHAAAVGLGLAAILLQSAMTFEVVAATFSAVGLSLVGLLAGRARRWLSSVRTHRIQEGVMGTVLVGLGIKVALDRP